MLNQYLNEFVLSFGYGFYLLLFLLVFLQIGLVPFFFIPGNALLFTVGAIAVRDNESLSLILLFLAAFFGGVFGGLCSYKLGSKFGFPLFQSSNSRFFKKQHLENVESFFKDNGASLFFLSPFIPNVRTLAPLFAGITQSSLSQFTFLSSLGVASWALIFLTLGALFGQTPSVKENFELVILGAAIVSLAPGVLRKIRKRKVN